MTHRQRRKSGKRWGATSVEFALVAPAMLAIIFVAFEFSRISMMRALAQSAAYEACRAAIVEGATYDETVEEAERILSRLGTENAVITVNDGEEITATTQTVHVLIEIPMEDNSFFFSSYFTGRYVTSEITLKTERYTGYFDSENL